MTLLAFADERRPCSNRSISPGRRAHSSKPASAACGGRMMDRTDRQTDTRQFHRPRLLRILCEQYRQSLYCKLRSRHPCTQDSSSLSRLSLTQPIRRSGGVSLHTKLQQRRCCVVNRRYSDVAAAVSTCLHMARCGKICCHCVQTRCLP